MTDSTEICAKIGIIGGSGLYQMEALQDVQEITIETPFGSPSDALIVGKLCGAQVAFISRHGRGHRLMPSEIPFRANIYALKKIGVEYLISASAVGSLKEEIKPRDLVISHQFIDRTQHRVSTFFGHGIVAHIGFGHPVCLQLSQILAEAIESLDLPELTLHKNGTYLCMEGPAFSTQAESELYRSWGASVIGMTNLPEAKLAREAEIAYASLNLVTDYDCWHPDHDHVTVEMILDNLHHNAENAQKVIQETVRRLQENPPVSDAHSALKYAVVTQPEFMVETTRKKLGLFLDKYSEFHGK